MIGIFDSGVGGLTVLRALREVLPSADVLYFGDTKNAPYGSRSRQELAELSMKGLSLLQNRGADNIISACNSVSVSLAVSLFDTFSVKPTQLIEMVGPTVGYFKDMEVDITLCATPATIASEIYQSGFRMIGKDIHSIAIERLAGAIEAGEPDTEIERIISEAFTGMTWKKNDVLVLGCTHYPLVQSLFRKVLGDDVLLFDPAYAVAERAERQFWPQESGNGQTTFITSGDSKQLRSQVERLFPGTEYSIEQLA